MNTSPRHLPSHRRVPAARRLALLAVALCLSHQLLAAPDDEVTVTTIEAEPIRGRLISLSLRDGAVVRTGGEKRNLLTADLVRIVFGNAASQEPREPILVERPADEVTVSLAGGDELRGRLTPSDGQALALETADFGAVTVPLDVIGRLTTRQASLAAFESSVGWFFRSPVGDEDAMLLTNGDVLRGFITRIDADGVAMDAATGSVAVPLRLVVAARISHPASGPLVGPRAVLRTRDGLRATALALDWRDETAEIRLPAGGEVRCPTDRITRIEFLGGRWEWLGDLRPVSAEQVPMFSMGWEHAVDRNVLGGPIVVAGVTYERGIGVHSRSVLAYDLQGAFKEFVTRFGLDDESGPYADVSVRILIDGQRRHEDLNLRRGTISPPIRLDVSRAGRLQLIVDFGENGDLQDRFNWVEPALIR